MERKDEMIYMSILVEVFVAISVVTKYWVGGISSKFMECLFLSFRLLRQIRSHVHTSTGKSFLKTFVKILCLYENYKHDKIL